MTTTKYELNLFDYWRVVKRRKWVILFTVFVTLVFTWIFTKLQVHIYQSQVVIKIEPSLFVPGIATDTLGWDSYQAINTEVKIINSPVILERVAKNLGLIDINTPQKVVQEIVSSLQGKVKAERVTDSNLVKITVTSSEKHEVAQIATAVAEVYIQKGIEDRNRRARELREFVEKQLQDAERNLKFSEEKLREFTEKTKITGTGGQLAMELVELEGKKNELLKSYTENHPEVVEVSRKIKFIEDKLKKLPKEELEYARLVREVKLNEELYLLLSKRAKEAQISEADRVQSAFIVSPAVEPQFPVRPNLSSNLAVGFVVGLVLGLIFAFVMEHLDTSIATIEEVETYLGLPVVGIIPHIDVGQKQLFGFIKYNESLEDIKKRLVIYHSQKSPYVETYHTLRTNIKFSQEQTETKGIVLFTSSGVGEGKTMTAINFALSSAFAGIKTLFIELDLRRPFVHKIFGLNRVPGFTDVIVGRKTFNEVVHTTTDFLLGGIDVDKVLSIPGFENFSFITCGNIPPNPVDILSSSNTTEIFKQLRKNYDLIVIDTPPILLFADGLILSKIVDTVVLVYRVGQIPRGALKRAKDQLLSVKANLVGLVLNDIRADEMEPRYGYYYAYKYYAREKK
jgi:capsular exopolysaccharide synthesis family protein